MSHIDDLISQLCPEGVKCVPINELFEVQNGYTPSKANPEYWEGGTIPWFRMDDIRANGRVLDSAKQNITESAVQGKRLFEANSLIISTTATIGEHALITSAFVANQQFTVLTPSNTYKEQVLPKYLYYFGFKLAEFSKTITNSSGYATVDMAKFKKFRFILPPLEVQQEIVRILDTFTELEAELEAELESRKKQYQYYCYKFLSTELPVSVEFKTLGELLGPIPRGKRLTKANLAEVGSIPVFHGGLNPIGYHDESNTAGETVMVINTGASSGRVGWSSAPFWCSDGCFALPHSEFISSRFLFHFACLNEKYFTEKVRKAGIPTLAAESILSLPIPVLPVSKQLEIAETLDAFFELTSNLSFGLPAEIEVRRRQYAYYRDKLLTFKELAA